MSVISLRHFCDMRGFTFILLSLVCGALWSQEDLKYDDWIYMPHVKSVKFHHVGLLTSDPIIDLNSNGQLVLTFDDILGGDISYNYKIIHCDKDWNPSDIDELEYISGFNDEDIDNWSYSNGTQIDYTQYQLRIPNEDVQPTLSGNYLLVVYEEDTEALVLSRRFMVVEGQVQVLAEIRRAAIANKIKSHHQIELKVNYENFDILNPQREVFVSILQNGRWDNPIQNVQPIYISGFNMKFDIANKLVFPGGKEFRFADLRSVRYPGYGVHSIDRQADRIDVILELDKTRAFSKLFDYDDLNGNFVIDNKDQSDDELSAQYVDTHFTLLDKNPNLKEQVYVIGKFTDWKCLNENKLEYDTKYESYVGSILLKQGYYDYQYVKKDKEGNINYDYYEGNLFDTINDYVVLVYYRAFNNRYDRLIGASVISSQF